MPINAGRVVAGGLLAGVVMNAVDFLGNGVWLADRWRSEAGALNARLVDPAYESGAMAGWIATDFLLGMLLVWVYAAMRPRFGAGPGTAIKAALFVWAISHIAYGSFVFTGMYSSGLVLMSSLAGLAAAIAGGLAGAWMYREDDALARRMARS